MLVEKVTPLQKATEKLFKPLRRFKYGRTIVLGMMSKGSFLMELPEAKTSWPTDLKKWARLAFPEIKWLGEKNASLEMAYELAATDFTCLVLHHCIHPEDLEFADEETKLHYDYFLTRFFALGKRAKRQAAYKLEGQPAKLPEGWLDHPDLPLAEYQRKAASFAYRYEGTALFMDRGTGKTCTSINLFCNYAEQKEDNMYRVLIVCPNQVRVNWQREIEKFATIPGKVTIIRGTKDARIRQFVQAAMPEDDCKFSAMIVGYDTLAADPSLYVARRMWDMVICDESHSFKSDRTARWRKAMLPLREASKRRLILSGSPIGNSIMDLWTQLEFLGQGLSGFSKMAAFRAYHGVFVDTKTQGVRKLIDTVNVAVLQERLSRVAYTITKEEAGLNLPDKVYDVHEVAMTPEQTKIYKQVATDLYAEIEDKLSGDASPMTIENALVSLLRLSQICSGFVTLDEVRDERTRVVTKPKEVRQISAVNPKIDAVAEMLLEADPLAKTIIWCVFVEDIKQNLALLERLGIKGGAYYGQTSFKEREANELAFNSDPEFKVIICNPKAASEGLNLLGYTGDQDTYCDHEIFFSQDWSAISRGQAEDRAHRRGTKMPVRITDLVVPQTIDEEIRVRVRNKQTNALSVLDVQEILRCL